MVAVGLPNHVRGYFCNIAKACFAALELATGNVAFGDGLLQRAACLGFLFGADASRRDELARDELPVEEPGDESDDKSDCRGARDEKMIELRNIVGRAGDDTMANLPN